jgi:hypothetical protein
MLRELTLDEMEIVGGGAANGGVNPWDLGDPAYAGGSSYVDGGSDGTVAVGYGSTPTGVSGVLHSVGSSASGDSGLPSAYQRNADGTLSLTPERQAQVDNLSFDWVGIAYDLAIITTGAILCPTTPGHGAIAAAAVGAAAGAEAYEVHQGH